MAEILYFQKYADRRKPDPTVDVTFLLERGSIYGNMVAENAPLTYPEEMDFLDVKRRLREQYGYHAGVVQAEYNERKFGALRSTESRLRSIVRITDRLLNF